MDLTDSEKPKEDSVYNIYTSEFEEVNNTSCNSTLNLNITKISNFIDQNKLLQNEQSISEHFEADQNLARFVGSNDEVFVDVNFNDNETFQESTASVDVPILNETKNSFSFVEQKIVENSGSSEMSVASVKVLKPLCADYKSDSESVSVDSESDSSGESDSTTADSSSEKECVSDDSYDSGTDGKEEKFDEGRKSRKDFSFSDLPPIENLKISVPEDACVEMGYITSIVETLVVVESYKGTAALDLDTVLFLDCGKKTLGKVFDILGPITEPVYAVRFNSQEEIKNLNLEKNMKVYYAPKTEHTLFVFMSEVLKNRGSDASWKDNAEAPPEFQDFSDDEQERLHKNKQVKESDRENSSLKEQTKTKKRPYNKMKQSSGIFQENRIRSPNFCRQMRPNIPRNYSDRHFAPPFPRYPTGLTRVFHPFQAPPYPPPNAVPIPPPVCYPTRFSGPPFPAFGGHSFFNQVQDFQNSFYQNRSHGFLQTFGPWRRPIRSMFVFQPPPPPPPSPPSTQGDLKS